MGSQEKQGGASRFRRFICYSLNSSIIELVGGIFVNLGDHNGGKNSSNINSERISIDQTLIVKQFGVNIEGVMDATNALVKEAQVALKNVTGLDAFMKNS
jgi:hypothetical protein